MNININNKSDFLKRVPRRMIRDIIDTILQDEKKKQSSLYSRFLKIKATGPVEVNIIFVDTKEMVRFNKKVFNRNRPTDVITFSMLEGEMLENNNLLGEAIICCQVACEDAPFYGNSYKAELSLLIIHAVLHLLGYDHDPDPGKTGMMRKKEQSYLCYFKEKYEF